MYWISGSSNGSGFGQIADTDTGYLSQFQYSQFVIILSFHSFLVRIHSAGCALLLPMLLVVVVGHASELWPNGQHIKHFYVLGPI